MKLGVDVDGGPPLGGVLFYSKREYSFRFVPASPDQLTERVGERGVTSLSVGTLQIEVGIEHKRALYVWGLHPYTRWKPGILDPSPIMRTGGVLFPSLVGL